VDYLETAIDLCRAAGDILNYYADRDKLVEFKGHANLVTIADKKSEELIIGGILSRYPSHSILAEESGASPEHYLEVFFPATIGLPQRWAATAKYEAKVDFQDDNTWTHSGKLAIAKELERVPLSFSLSIKKAFDGGGKKFEVNFIATWFVRSKAPPPAEGT